MQHSRHLARTFSEKSETLDCGQAPQNFMLVKNNMSLLFTWVSLVGVGSIWSPTSSVDAKLIPQRSVMPFAVFCARVERLRVESELEEQKREVSEYARLVGGRLAGDMLLYRTWSGYHYGMFDRYSSRWQEIKHQLWLERFFICYNAHWLSKR